MNTYSRAPHTRNVAIILGLLSLLLLPIAANTQPAPKPMAKPAPMAMTAVMAPTAAATMAAPKPATMAAPMATMTAPKAAAMEAPKAPASMGAMTTVPKPAAKSKDAKAAFWLTILGPVLLGILMLLGGLGLLKKLGTPRAQVILKMVKSGVESFWKYSEGTSAEWDNALAKLLKDVNNYLIATGEQAMTKQEEDAAKSAAVAAKKIVGPDKPKDDA